MARTGTVIANPNTGERVRWHLTGAETEGRLVRAEWWTQPGGGVSFEHVHREAEERFEVLAGRLAAEVDGRRVDVGPGERVALPAGVPHRWWNAGGDELHFMLEIAPAGHFVETIETLFGLAREGRVRSNGMPGLLQLAVMSRAFDFEAHPSSPPLPVLRALAAVLAPIGRLAGRRPTYPRSSPTSH